MELCNISCCGVVVITLVLHTKGPQFDPGQQHKQVAFLIHDLALGSWNIFASPQSLIGKLVEGALNILT